MTPLSAHSSTYWESVAIGNVEILLRAINLQLQPGVHVRAQAAMCGLPNQVARHSLYTSRPACQSPRIRAHDNRSEIHELSADEQK